jgi:RNA polymerase sigma factor (sigma-70 family)
MRPGGPVPSAGGGQRLDAAHLGRLLETMRAGSPADSDEAWAECFRRYYDRVWARVFYVVRTIHWLREPREEAADVAGQVFLGLREAVRAYREQGKAEQWLMRVAVRTALRHRESVTGRWSSGRTARSAQPPPRGRSYLGLDDLVEEIASTVEEAEADERFDLRRRLAAWERSPERRKYLPFIELFLEGYGHDEIAERLGITPGTSRTWLWKVRQHLAEGLEHEMTRDDQEVAGRDAAGAEVISLVDRLDAHPADEALQAFAEWRLEEPGWEAVRAHRDRCGRCAELVSAQRAGAAMLALAAEPAPLEFETVLQRWRSGERAFLGQADDSWAAVDDLAEVSGRDATPLPDPAVGEGEAPEPGDGGRSS